MKVRGVFIGMVAANEIARVARMTPLFCPPSVWEEKRQTPERLKAEDLSSSSEDGNEGERLQLVAANYIERVPTSGSADGVFRLGGGARNRGFDSDG